MNQEYIEAQVVSLTRRIHPQDLGEETSKLENILRQALEDAVAEERGKRLKDLLSTLPRKFFEDEDHAVGGYISKKDLYELLTDKEKNI